MDMGDKLKPGGKVVTASGVTDGPFVEAKEIVGGYMIVSAESYEHAIEVAQECPGMMMPGSSVEIAGDREVPPDRWTRSSESGRRGRGTGPGRAFLPARIRPAGGDAHAHGRRTACRDRRGRGPGRAHGRADGMDGARVFPNDPGAWLYRVGLQQPDREILRRKAGRLRILLERADDRWRLNAPTLRRHRISPARCGTTCCGCSSSAATTPFRGSRGWSSR